MKICECGRETQKLIKGKCRACYYKEYMSVYGKTKEYKESRKKYLANNLTYKDHNRDYQRSYQKQRRRIMSQLYKMFKNFTELELTEMKKLYQKSKLINEKILDS